MSILSLNPSRFTVSASIAVAGFVALTGLAGCAVRVPTLADVVYQEAHEACTYEKNKVGGFDWIDAINRRSDVYHYCMKTKGQTPRL